MNFLVDYYGASAVDKRTLAYKIAVMKWHQDGGSIAINRAFDTPIANISWDWSSVMYVPIVSTQDCHEYTPYSMDTVPPPKKWKGLGISGVQIDTDGELIILTNQGWSPAAHAAKHYNMGTLKQPVSTYRRAW